MFIIIFYNCFESSVSKSSGFVCRHGVLGKEGMNCLLIWMFDPGGSSGAHQSCSLHLPTPCHANRIHR